MPRYRLTSKQGEATFTGTSAKARRYCQALADAMKCEVIMVPVASPKPRRKRRAAAKAAAKPARRRRRSTVARKRASVRRSTRRSRRSASVQKRRKGRR